MMYESTRGDYRQLTAAEAIKAGISPDGGLFVPVEKVSISADEIAVLAGAHYRDRAIKILHPFLSGFTLEEISQCVNSAYNDNSFDHPDIAPVVQLTDKLGVLELWHGPTCAFKDMALQILPHLLVKSMEKTGETTGILILVATSGDTGKAALEGFKDVPRTAIVVFYPDKGVSEVQKLQMITQEGGNVGVFAVRGNFDDAQTGVKEIFGDFSLAGEVLQRGYKFSSANSINWGRLVPQIVYYFSAYADLLARRLVEPGKKVNFVVPTGNFGNILAGFYASRMGLPVNKLICASNENNVLHDFIRTGVYDRKREFKKTLSPSMDILISSNLERLLFELTDHDAAMVRRWMLELKENGNYEVDDVTRARVRDFFWSDFASDAETIQSIKDTYARYGYTVDTHTAVGMNVYEKYRQYSGDNSFTVVLSTASPFKFNTSVARALLSVDKTDGKSEFELLQMLSDFINLPVPPGLRDLDKRPVRHGDVVEKEEMKRAVISFLDRL